MRLSRRKNVENFTGIFKQQLVLRGAAVRCVLVRMDEPYRAGDGGVRRAADAHSRRMRRYSGNDAAVSYFVYDYDESLQFV